MRADELPPLTGFLLGGRVDAGIDVSPYRLADAGATVGFALRLSGPLAHAADMGGLRPFLMTGPALFLLEPRDAGTLPVPQGEPGAVLGLRAGAAGRVAARPQQQPLRRVPRDVRGRGRAGPFGGGRAGEVGGHDVLYGVRFRF